MVRRTNSGKASRRVGRGAAAVVLAGSLAACGSSHSTASSGTSKATGSAAGSSSSGARNVTVAWIQIGANNPFWDDENLGAAAAAKKNGFNFRELSGNNSVSTQSTELEQLVNQHVSVIMVTAIDIGSMTQALNYAKQHNVPVISLYSSSPQATMSAGFDEEAVGHDMAVFSVQQLQKRYGKPMGDVAVLGGQLGQTLNLYRNGGFVDVMKHYPDIHVVANQPTNWEADQAQSLMQDWLSQYQNLSLVYGESDTITVPAITVAQRANRVCDVGTKSWSSNPSCVMFTSVDGDPIGIKAIQQGTLAGTDLYAPLWAGYQFAMMGYNLAAHKSKPQTTVLQALPVDATNVNCINKMQTDMANQTDSFNFNGTLAQIAARYGCPIVTISGGPPVKGGQQF